MALVYEAGEDMAGDQPVLTLDQLSARQQALREEMNKGGSDSIRRAQQQAQMDLLTELIEVTINGDEPNANEEE